MCIYIYIYYLFINIYIKKHISDTHVSTYPIIYKYTFLLIKIFRIFLKEKIEFSFSFSIKLLYTFDMRINFNLF